MVVDRLIALVSEALGMEVINARALGGGDVADAFHLWTEDGDSVFAKTKVDARPGFFVTEATGLEWLNRTGTVTVPLVLAVGDGVDDLGFLALQWVPEGRPGPDTESEFGDELARLHAVPFECFGRPDEARTGSRGLPNQPTASWVDFYRDRRLLPLADMAADADALPPTSIDAIRAVADRLGDLAAPIAGDPPSLLHGDLWGGNRLIDTGGRSWLIDPAAHGGHREFDLAMMALFGGFGPAAFEAYHARNPLTPGFEDRVPLHQLAPLVVHAIKFGGGYVSGVQRALAALP